MNTTQTHASVTVDGKTLFTLPAKVRTQGKHSSINISVNGSQLGELFQVLRQEERRQQAIKERQQAERLKKQANQLANELTELPVSQQIHSMMRLIVFPTIKSWRRQNQKEENHNETN